MVTKYQGIFILPIDWENQPSVSWLAMAVSLHGIYIPQAWSQTLISHPLVLPCFSAGHRASCSLPRDRVSTPFENYHSTGEGLWPGALSCKVKSNRFLESDTVLELWTLAAFNVGSWFDVLSLQALDKRSLHGPGHRGSAQTAHRAEGKLATWLSS